MKTIAQEEFNAFEQKQLDPGYDFLALSQEERDSENAEYVAKKLARKKEIIANEEERQAKIQDNRSQAETNFNNRIIEKEFSGKYEEQDFLDIFDRFPKVLGKRMRTRKTGEKNDILEEYDHAKEYFAGLNIEQRELYFKRLFINCFGNE